MVHEVVVKNDNVCGENEFAMLALASRPLNPYFNQVHVESHVNPGLRLAGLSPLVRGEVPGRIQSQFRSGLGKFLRGVGRIRDFGFTLSLNGATPGDDSELLAGHHLPLPVDHIHSLVTRESGRRRLLSAEARRHKKARHGHEQPESRGSSHHMGHDGLPYRLRFSAGRASARRNTVKPPS